MNIPFRRIGKIPQEFEITSGDVTLKGTLRFKERNLIKMEAEITGTLELPCDICAEPFDLAVDDKLELLICDGLYSGTDNDLDVIEMNNDSIDMDELLHSEIELIKSDYNCCEKCKTEERI